MKASQATIDKTAKDQARKILKGKLVFSSKKKIKTLADFYGKLPGVYGDALAYQKQLRDEW